MKSTSILALAGASAVSANLNQLAVSAGLKYFGSATDNSELSDSAYVAILKNKNEFGQITPGNGQKWQYTEPSEGSFSWTQGDQIVKFAEGNGQIVRCHNLVWHSQLPSWVSSGSWTAAQLTSVIQTHIAAEVGHYVGQCYAWDVVNEALNEDGTLRSDVFGQVLSYSYIPIAFKAARAADPAAKLYYNDYNIGYSGSKHTAALALIDTIRNAGAEIDGIGEQGHYIVGSTPSQSDLQNVAASYVAKNVEFAYTEVDIRFSSLPPSNSGLQQQATDYKSVVQACLNVKGCVGITVWDFTDKYSWIPGTFSGQGEACLYDANLSQKPAYTTVSSVLAAAATGGVTTGVTTTTTATSTTTSTTATSTTATSTPTAVSAHWQQCGGIGWTGATVCESPYTCQYVNAWYSQCL